MDDASFEGVLDRVATTADCSAVRDTILIFPAGKVTKN